jgi:hypothetical protein
MLCPENGLPNTSTLPCLTLQNQSPSAREGEIHLASISVWSDNASCESVLKTLKREEIYANQYRDRYCSPGTI